ncbi:MAG: glycerol uptake facilitator protein [Actinomycetota bacterium]|jgi:glycerol uptake facilitator protein|nr:glycerol uptake facilitator protein [Actinomycetota bacterium]
MLDESSLAQRLTAEFIGTAFLVFIGVGSVPATLIVNGNAPFTMADLGMISLAFGTAVVATVYALGHIGGNHINPAVTLGLAVSGKFPWRHVPGYVAAQVAGAVLGAVTILGVLGKKASDVGLGVASYGPAISWTQAFTAEFVGTFILVFTVFGVIHRKAAAGFAGLAIGLVVFAVIIPVAPTTGASINPARTIGPMLVQEIAGGQVKWGQLPIYLVAELLAGAAAALVYGVLARTPADRAAPAGIDLADPESLSRQSSDFRPSNGQSADSQPSNRSSLSRPDRTQRSD